jgi:phosphatidate cytidylyltransferase
VRRVLTAVVLVPLVLLVVFIAPLWLFALVVAGIVVLALYEYLNITKSYGIEPLRWATYIASLLLIVGWSRWETSFLASLNWLSVIVAHGWSALLAFSLIFGIPVVFRRDMRAALTASAASAFGILYIAAPLGVLTLLRRDPFLAVFLLFALFSVWAGDTAAFYVGRSIGRHKLASVVSPGKTWEGAVAAVIASVAVAFVVFHFETRLAHMLAWHKFDFSTDLSHPTAIDEPSRPGSIGLVVLGIATSVAAQFGDLFESAIKRGAQMKDSGSLLPGHGGILDRIDALLFAIPAVWYYAVFYSIFVSSQ